MDDSTSELVGIGPKTIGFFLAFTVLFPLGTFTTGHQMYMVYSIFWIFDIHSFAFLINFGFLFFILPLSIFNFLYIRQILRFFDGSSSRESAQMCGLISLIFPSLVGLGVSTLLSFSYSEYLYFIPIPLQFIAGLFFLNRYREPEVISPWSGQFIDWSWWKRLGVKWSNWVTDLIELHFEEEEIIMNMTLAEVEEYYGKEYDFV